MKKWVLGKLWQVTDKMNRVKKMLDMFQQVMDKIKQGAEDC